MQQINTKSPFFVKKIVFKDEESIDCYRHAYIYAGFLVLESRNEENAANWYNLDSIQTLIGVTFPKQEETKAVRIGIF